MGEIDAVVIGAIFCVVASTAIVVVASYKVVKLIGETHSQD